MYYIYIYIFIYIYIYIYIYIHTFPPIQQVTRGEHSLTMKQCCVTKSKLDSLSCHTYTADMPSLSVFPVDCRFSSTGRLNISTGFCDFGESFSFYW